MKPILNEIRGEKAKTVPFWLMRQAGRYLPEYRELRSRKGGFLEMAMDPVSACEVTMQPIRRFGMDAAIIFSDILVVPFALGQKLSFEQGEGPKLDPVSSVSDLSLLTFKDFERKLSPVYEAIERVSQALKNEGFYSACLIGFAGAPWTVAAYMVEGGGSKDFFRLKSFAMSDPETFSKLMDLLIDATSLYLIAQVRAGAEILKLFDSWSGICDFAEFEQYCIQPVREIVRRVKAACPGVPIIGFPRGAGIRYGEYAAKAGVDVVATDSSLSPAWIKETLQNVMPVQGNLDPAVLLAGGDVLESRMEMIFSQLSAGSFIFNLGHGIHKDTPPQHVLHLSNIVKNHARP